MVEIFWATLASFIHFSLISDPQINFRNRQEVLNYTVVKYEKFYDRHVALTQAFFKIAVGLKGITHRSNDDTHKNENSLKVKKLNDFVSYGRFLTDVLQGDVFFYTYHCTNSVDTQTYFLTEFIRISDFL